MSALEIYRGGFCEWSIGEGVLWRNAGKFMALITYDNGRWHGEIFYDQGLEPYAVDDFPNLFTAVRESDLFLGYLDAAPRVHSLPDRYDIMECCGEEPCFEDHDVYYDNHHKDGGEIEED